MSAPEEPKIIIDSDWKSQAKAEKERLAQSAAKAAPAPAPGAPPAGRAPGPDEPAGFRDLLSLLISQTLAYLGAYPDPRTGQAIVALEAARFHIDLLEVLETKTKGNLTDDEARLLSKALNELRLEYVDIAKAVAQAVKEGRTRTVGPGGAVAGPAADINPKLSFPGSGPVG